MSEYKTFCKKKFVLELTGIYVTFPCYACSSLSGLCVTDGDLEKQVKGNRENKGKRGAPRQDKDSLALSSFVFGTRFVHPSQ